MLRNGRKERRESKVTEGLEGKDMELALDIGGHNGSQ